MMETLAFRRAQISDFEAVVDLAGQLASQIEEEKPPLTLAQFETYYLQPRRQCTYYSHSRVKEL